MNLQERERASKRDVKRSEREREREERERMCLQEISAFLTNVNKLTTARFAMAAHERGGGARAATDSARQ